MQEAGGEAIGYKGDVLFPVEVTPKDPGEPVSSQAGAGVRHLPRHLHSRDGQTFILAMPPGEAAYARAARWPQRSTGCRRPQQSRRNERSRAQASRASTARRAAARLWRSRRIFKNGATGRDIFIEAPEGLYVPMPKRLPGIGERTVASRFASELSPTLAPGLKGKTLTLTLVSERGATETQLDRALSGCLACAAKPLSWALCRRARAGLQFLTF